VIGLPFNDLRCLGSITEVIAELVTNRDEVILELAQQHSTIEGLTTWIRSLPQRDDEGEQNDGPKVDECKPPQRLRIPAEDPNCVERAALYLAVAEMIDPKPVRQLATLDTEIGLHTFPVENGAPIILDPRLPRNCLDCGVACLKPGPAEIEARDAIEWTAQLAEAGAANLRNGPSRVRKARNAIMQLVEEGAAPADAQTIDSIGWLLALAERVARKYGPRALTVVRSTAQAVADLAEEALARGQRNISLQIGKTRLEPAPWVSMLARIAGRVGADVGAVALRTKLASLGIGADMFGLVEEELNREGLTLGALAKPRKLPTIASFAAKRVA
jgi:hypothetical protein